MLSGDVDRELVRAGTEQLHNNGGATGLYGVSHGELQLHVPHQFKPTVNRRCAWLVDLVQRRQAILVFIVRLQPE